MKVPKSRTALFIAVPLLLLMLPLAVWLADRVVSSGEVPRNVSVAGVPVGGLGEEDALVAIRAYEANLQSEPAIFTLNGTSYDLNPTTVGLAVDAEAALVAAMGARSGGLMSFFESFSDPVDVPVTVVVDEVAVDATLETWESEAITDHAFEGMIEVAEGRVRFEYPRNGEVLDLDPARQIVYDVLATPESQSGDLPVAVDTPDLTVADIDAGVADLERLIGEPVTLRNDAYDFDLTFVTRMLSAAVRVEITHNSPAAIEISIDPDAVASYVEPRRAQYEIEPVNADFDIDLVTNAVSIIPSLNGTRVDTSLLVQPLFEAAMSDTNQGEFPIVETVEPEFTTAEAEAFGPLGLVSEFTTNTPGVNRVHNIHLMADTIDGHIVWPGEEFSINDFVGARTLAGGYLRDGAIIAGEVTCCDEPANIGGGVSQYGTTFYNAVFFGCYEDLEHTPHSLYISRYPEGREATLGYPEPDVRIRNDSAAPLIIKHVYDDDTITVRFYGNNGGRICTDEKGERFGSSGPPIRYEADPTVPPGTERIASQGSRGWSITVTRVITFPDGTVERQPYTHQYRGDLRKILVNPCNMPGANLECPTQVPSVVGQTQDAASAALAGAGFGVTVTVKETTADKVGIVLSQSPGGGAFLEEGETVTIVVGVNDEPDE